MFPRVYFGARYFAPRYFGGAASEVVEPPAPTPAPEQQSTGVFGGINPPFFSKPIRPVIGDLNAVLPDIDGEIVGYSVWVVSGDVVGEIGLTVTGEIDGKIDGIPPIIGSVDAEINIPAISINGRVELLHDEEFLLLMLAA